MKTHSDNALSSELLDEMCYHLVQHHGLIKLGKSLSKSDYELVRKGNINYHLNKGTKKISLKFNEPGSVLFPQEIA